MLGTDRAGQQPWGGACATERIGAAGDGTYHTGREGEKEHVPYGAVSYSRTASVTLACRVALDKRGSPSGGSVLWLTQGRRYRCHGAAWARGRQFSGRIARWARSTGALRHGEPLVCSGQPGVLRTLRSGTGLSARRVVGLRGERFLVWLADGRRARMHTCPAICG